MKITNNSAALQGINALSGVVYLKPGESRDLDVSDVELAGLKRLSFLNVEAPVDADGDGVANSPDRDELKKQATELGLDFPKNIPTDKLKAMVDAKLAA